MKYDLTAQKILERLGLKSADQVDWMEALQQERHLPLPKVYRSFMKLAANAPLFATSDLWVGKMCGVTLTPYTLYDQIKEEIADMRSQWEEQPEEREGILYDLSQLSEAAWPQMVEDYLLIGSDYGGGSVNFGIRLTDLEQDAPPVYWSCVDVDLKNWQTAALHLSEFFKEVLSNVLSCVDYDTPEEALEQYGWTLDEYLDKEQGDWIAPPAVIQRLGIDMDQVKPYPLHNADIQTFICYDDARNIFFVGNIEDEEVDLRAVYQTETEDVFG